MANDFQSDILVNVPNETNTKCTIPLSPTGDLQLVTGRDKLVEQMLRAIVNKNVFNNVLNTRGLTTRLLKAKIVSALAVFRSNQVSYVNSCDPDLTGFSIWRRAAGSNENYARVSAKAITVKFTDTGLENGKSYDYGVAHIYRNVFETKLIDTFSVTPTAQTHQRQWVISAATTAFAYDSAVDIYVDYNKHFKASELLNKVLSIQVSQSEVDPRLWALFIKVMDLLQNDVDVSSSLRQTALGL